MMPLEIKGTVEYRKEDSTKRNRVGELTEGEWHKMMRRVEK